MKKRLLSAFLIFSMLLTVVPMNVIAVEDKNAERSDTIETAALPELEYADGLSYAGFTTQQAKLPEKGLYSLTIGRTGDTSIGSDLVVSTVDIGAVYGKDYVIEDSRFETEIVETNGTVLEQAASKENRENAQEELEEIREQIIGSTAEVADNAETDETVVDKDGDGKLSLAELKESQSGKNTRELTETDFHSLKDEFISKMNIDIADYVAVSSETRISFKPDEITKTLTFRILEDNESEGEEMFNFLLSAEDTNTAVIEANTSISFIIEDDEPVEHSVVTLTADTFTAKDGVLTVSAKREVAEYSYTTVGVKLTGRDTDLFEGTEYTIVFQPYQTESSIEIPVTQNGKEHKFTVELYDFKGCNEGSTLKAQVKIPAVTEKKTENDSPNSYLDDFKKSETTGKLTAGRTSINIAGRDCEIVYDDPDHSNYGSIMLDGSKIGIYVSIDRMSMFSQQFREGSGDHEIRIENDGNPYLYLEYYSGWVWNKGWAGVAYYYDNPGRYQLIMMDYSTDSSYPNAAIAGTRNVTYASSGKEISNVCKWIGGENSRQPRLAMTLLKQDGNNYVTYPEYATKGLIRPFVERATQDLARPNANFYGFVMLYREYRVKVEQPDKLAYRSGELNADGTPKMVSLSPATISAVTPEIRYYGAPVQFDEYPAKGNKTIYGELEGYYITPLGGKTFFYRTNQSSFELDDDLIKQIDLNTTKVQKNIKMDTGDYLAYTTITIKPKYKYKNVSMNLLSPKGLPDGAKYSYLDKDLENMNKNGILTNTTTFHIGDTMNLEMQAIGVSESFVSYNQYQYRNPGDTAYDKNVPHTDNYVEGTIPGWVLECPKCEVRGIFGRQNYISIEIDELAERYFTIRNLVPQNELTLSYMQGLNILAISNTNGGTSKTMPVVGRAYTIELDPTEDNEQKWRPVITFAATGQRVNGFAADFIARDNYQDNVVRISAERYSPDWYEYFSVDSTAYYSAYSLRANSEAVKRSPVMQAIVTGGSSDLEVYTSNKELKYIATRFNTTTDNNGNFSLALRAVEGDTVSIVVDNNDMQQVKYVRMMRPSKKVLKEHPEIYTRTGVFDELVADTEKQQNVNRRIETSCAIVSTSNIDMPIRTFYSPYVNSVSANYKRTVINPSVNQIPIYDSDEMTLSVNVMANEANIKKVNIKKIARNGSVMDFEGSYDLEASSSYDKKYDFTVSGQDLAPLDRFYVQVTAIPKGGTREITYTALDTGLEMYMPLEQKPAQFLNYELPTPYDDLPVLGDMAGDLDSGKLSWKTVYADENNKGTSPYAEIVTLSVSKKDIEEKSEQLKKLDGDEDKKSWDTMLKDKESDVYKYLNKSTQDNIYESYKAKKKDNTITKEQAANYFNSHPEEKKKYQDEFKQNAKKDALEELGETEIDVSVSVLVQLEYNYNPVKRTHYYSGGQYIIKAAVSVEKTFYWTVFGVPVYLNIAGEASLQFDGRYVTDQEETTAQEMGYYENLAEKVESEWPYLQVGLGIKLQPGIGICGILGVRGIIDFAFVARRNLNMEEATSTMGTFTGGVGVDLLLFSFEYEIGSIGWQTGLFKDGNVEAGTPTEETFSLRKFDNGKEYKNDNLRSTLLPDAKTTLINGAMEYIRPQLIDLGDGRTMLLFLRNMSDSERDDKNASTLVYAIRSADGTWDKDSNNNISSTVVENDNMADSTFAAMKSGNKVYIAWTNADVSADFENDIENAKEVLKSSNIHMAVFDIQTEKMSEPFAVTDDEFVNSDVILSQEGSNIALYYFKKDISTSEEITDLVGLSNNYNTWARKVYDPAKKQFIAVAAGKTNPEEELIVIDHPTIEDAMVTDLSAADYQYGNKNYRIYSYTIDLDGNLETTSDHELWIRITNLTDNRDYYPMPIDAGKDNVLSPKLTRIEDDVYLTWLSNDCTYNAISANSIFNGLNAVRGTGEYSNASGLDMIRSLSDEEISKSGWYKLPYDKLENASQEEQGALYDLSRSKLENQKKEFGELNNNNKYEGATLNDHQLVAGGDGNLYLFWTKQPNIDVENDTGRELYGAALYRGENTEYSGWSDGVKLTNYGKVIDELTVSVSGDKGAILVGNLYSQEIGFDGKVVYDDHELAEIDFVPGNSLEFALGDIILSDYYPVEGEKVTAKFGIENNGLLPAEKYNLTVNGEKTTVEGDAIYPTQSTEHNREFVAGKDGALTVSAEVRELGEVQELAVKDSDSNKTSVSTKKGAVLQFGEPAIYTRGDVFDCFDDSIEIDMADRTEENVINTVKNIFDVSSVSDERFKAVITEHIRSTILYQNPNDYYACIPITNVGNLPANNLDIEAYVPAGSTDQVTEDKPVGIKKVSFIPVKTVDDDGNVIEETVYAVIPLMRPLDMRTDCDDLGVFHLRFKFELDGEELEETAVAERQFLENIALSVNDDGKTIKVGETFQIETQAYPWDELKELVYDVVHTTYDDDDAVTVTSDGLVTGIKEGKNMIFVTDLSAKMQGSSIIIVNVTNPDAHVVNFVDKFDVNSRTVTVNDGDTINTPVILPQDGYEFEGWYTDEEYTMQFDFDTPITEDITLYAKWTEEQVQPEVHTVTFIDELTGRPDKIPVKHGEKISNPPTPEQDGWIFEGWYADENYTALFDFNTPVTQNVKLYAKWTEESSELINVSEISADEIVLGDTLTVNAAATGGKGDYTYAVYYKKTSDEKWTTKQKFTNNAQVTIKPAKATSYEVCAKVRDESGTIVKKYFTLNVTEKLENISEISATEITLGDKLTVNAAATGGKGNYTYAVYYKKTSDTKWTTAQNFTDNAQVSIEPTKAAAYDICVKVRDESNKIVKKYFTLNVTAKLENISEISADEITLGDTLTVKAAATGGKGNYTYAVYYKKTSDKKWTTAQNFTDNAQVTVKPAKATSYDVCAKVRDESGTIVKKYFTLNVTAKLENISEISANEITLGDKLTVNAAATGGKGNYTYAVYYKKTSDTKWTTAQNFTENAQAAIEPAKAAAYDICVKARDESGNIVNKYFTLNVIPKLENISKISATEITLNDTLTVDATATGGKGNYKYAVYYKKTSDKKWTTAQSFTDNSKTDVKFTEAANYDVCVKVMDGNGTIAKKYFTVTVKAAEKPTPDLTVNITQTGNTIIIELVINENVDSLDYTIHYKKISDTD